MLPLSGAETAWFRPESAGLRPDTARSPGCPTIRADLTRSRSDRAPSRAGRDRRRARSAPGLDPADPVSGLGAPAGAGLASRFGGRAGPPPGRVDSGAGRAVEFAGMVGRIAGPVPDSAGVAEVFLGQRPAVAGRDREIRDRGRRNGRRYRPFPDRCRPFPDRCRLFPGRCRRFPDRCRRFPSRAPDFSGIPGFRGRFPSRNRPGFRESGGSGTRSFRGEAEKCPNLVTPVCPRLGTLWPIGARSAPPKTTPEPPRFRGPGSPPDGPRPDPVDRSRPGRPFQSRPVAA